MLHVIQSDYIENRTDIVDVAYDKLYDLKLREPLQDDHDYYDIPNIINLSDYIENVVAYIAGFVVRMVQKIIKCNICCAALLSIE